MILQIYFLLIKIINFRGDLSDISAETATHLASPNDGALCFIRSLHWKHLALAHAGTNSVHNGTLHPSFNQSWNRFGLNIWLSWYVCKLKPAEIECECSYVSEHSPEYECEESSHYLLFWVSHTPYNLWEHLLSKMFIGLGLVAARVLAMPVTSCAAERNCTISGRVYIKTRSNLGLQRA